MFGIGKDLAGLSSKAMIDDLDKCLEDDSKLIKLVKETSATGRQVVVSDYGRGFLYAAEFSPDGRRMAVGIDQTIQIIELNPKLFQ